MTTNAQAALQSAVTLHARISGKSINESTRNTVKHTANSFKEWLDENTEPREETIVALSPVDRELLRGLRPVPPFPTYPNTFPGVSPWVTSEVSA